MSRKEFDMSFKLNAELGSSYSSTFSKAQSKLAEMQKEIQAMNKAQADISAYQKQQSAVDATNKKLEVLQQQYDNIKKEIQETTGFSATLENQLLSKEQQINKTSESLQHQTEKLNQMDAALREAGIDTGNLSQASAELSVKTEELKREQEEVAQSAQDAGDSMAAGFDAAASAFAAAGIAAGLKEIYDGYMECIGIAGDFEETMSTVEALSSANADEMSELSTMAKELGATTKFTAEESAEAMTYMGMAGWDASEMLSGMDGVLQLAAASGEDLAMVSDIVTDNLTAFGLAASDTAHFSDVLAAAATNSNTSVSIMGETFKNSASIAGALGYSVEDVAVAVGLMANSGIKGSIAGTALKNTFNGLLEGVTLTSEAFGEYEYSALNADGTMKSFGDTVNELRGRFEQMTEAERVSNAMAIAGSRSYNGLLAIVNATDEDFDSLSKSINTCSGAAAKMAAIKLDNLNGDITLMNSAVDAFKTTLGEQFIPEMRTTYSIGTDIFNMLNYFVTQHPALVKAVTVFIGLIGAATAALTAYAAITKIIKLLDIASLFAGPAGTAMLLVSGVAAGVAALVGFATAIGQSSQRIEELTVASRNLQSALDEADAAYESIASETMAAATVADGYITKLEKMGDYASLSAEEQKEYHNILSLLCETVPELADKIDLENNTIEGGTAALRANTEAWKENILQQAQQETAKKYAEAYNDILIEQQKNEIGLTKAKNELGIAEKAREDTEKRMSQLMDEATEKARQYTEQTGEAADATSFLTQEYYDCENSLWDYDTKISDCKDNIKAHENALLDNETAAAEAKEELDNLGEALAVLNGEYSDSEGLTEAQQFQLDSLNDSIGTVTDSVSSLTEEYNAAYESALESVQGQYSLWDEAAGVVAISAGEINSALESQITYWQDYNSNLQTLSERSADIDGLSEVIASFADGSEESVNAVAGMATASDEDLTEMVANWKTLQEEQETVSGGIADTVTDYSNRMDELVNNFEADVKAMNLSEEAAESGRATIQAYIDAANSMRPSVQTAYSNLALAASRSLKTPVSYNGTTYHGYAVGTLSADEGWAWVGENGPELMYMNGGETIFPNDISTAIASAQSIDSYKENLEITAFAPQLISMLGAYGAYASADAVEAISSYNEAPVSVQVVFQVNGNPSPETVSALESYGDDFAERVLEVLYNAKDDAKRSVYE